MRGDDTHEIAAGGDASPVRRGPRHAAPRKSLLTKLHIPAGKAMALAAMPTAVFVGMGLTPRLALADDNKDIPFAPGPCVTRSDDPDASPSPSSSPSKSPEPGSSASATPEPSASGTPGDSATDGGKGDEPDPSASSDAGKTEKPEPGASSSPSPTPTPSESKSRNPLDPLGVGDALGDLLGIPGKDGTAAPKPSASASEKPDDDASAGSTSKPSTSKPSASDQDDTADDKDDKGKGKGKDKDKAEGKAKDAAEDGKDTDAADDADKAADGTKKAIEDAARKAGATVEELGEDAKGLKARKGDDIPAGATDKRAYPCPTPDPEALANAEQEQGIPLLPDDPWILHSSNLQLYGLKYHGIVEVKTYGGQVKKALKFTATSVDIENLHQTVRYPMGRTAHVQGREGSTSTIRDTPVTMYTEQLKGNLFGLIPVTFSPQTPPPLDVPYASFTDVEVVQAGQFGGTLTIPGLQNYLTG
nr:hypothetical protein OH820_25305 [Streptomyces sp. NBC_00857]